MSVVRSYGHAGEVELYLHRVRTGTTILVVEDAVLAFPNLSKTTLLS